MMEGEDQTQDIISGGGGKKTVLTSSLLQQHFNTFAFHKHICSKKISTSQLD